MSNICIQKVRVVGNQKRLKPMGSKWQKIKDFIFDVTESKSRGMTKGTEKIQIKR